MRHTFLDAHARAQGYPARSAVLHTAVGLLRSGGHAGVLSAAQVRALDATLRVHLAL